MSFATKQRVLALVLAVVTLWPLGHHVLYRTAFIDPWKLFGWSMYARPRGQLQIALLAVRNGVPVPIAEPSAHQREVFHRVNAWCAAFGDLAGVQPLADVVLDENPGVDAVRITVRATDYDPDTNRYDRERVKHHDFARAR